MRIWVLKLRSPSRSRVPLVCRGGHATFKMLMNDPWSPDTLRAARGVPAFRNQPSPSDFTLYDLGLRNRSRNWVRILSRASIRLAVHFVRERQTNNGSVWRFLWRLRWGHRENRVKRGPVRPASHELTFAFVRWRLANVLSRKSESARACRAASDCGLGHRRNARRSSAG